MSGNGRTRKLLRNCPILLACALWTSAPAGRGEDLDLPTMFREGIPPSPFINVVYGYADAMLQHGRDTYGPQKTGLLLSALNRHTLSPLKARPDAPHGTDGKGHSGPSGGLLVGSNPQVDQNVLRLLYFLVGLSGEERYAQAADQELTWFLENAALEETGRLPWDEDLCWNVITDEVVRTAKSPTGKLFGPWMLWPRCFQLAPEQSKRFVEAARAKLDVDLRDTILSETLADGPASHPALESRRQAGFFVRTMAEAYAHTKDKTLLTAIEAVLRSDEEKQLAGGQPTESGSASSRVSSVLSLAIDCDGAARKVPEPLRTRLTNFAAREDRLFCSLPHDLRNTGGFITSVDRETAGPDDRYTSLWKMRQGERTTAAVAMMCVSRYENTGKVGYRKLIVAAADAYLDSLPDDQTDAWPMTFGHAISLELAAFRITARQKYHARAFKLGEIAVQRFFGDRPLPRASLKTDHYESATGAGTLVLALAELHLSTLAITAVRAPVNTIDR